MIFPIACPRGNPAYLSAKSQLGMSPHVGCTTTHPCPDPFQCTDVASQSMCCPSRSRSVWSRALYSCRIDLLRGWWPTERSSKDDTLRCRNEVRSTDGRECQLRDGHQHQVASSLPASTLPGTTTTRLMASVIPSLLTASSAISTISTTRPTARYSVPGVSPSSLLRILPFQSNALMVVL